MVRTKNPQRPRATKTEIIMLACLTVAASQELWLAPIAVVLWVQFLARFYRSWADVRHRFFTSTWVVVALSVGSAVIGALSSFWSNELAHAPPTTWIIGEGAALSTVAPMIFWLGLLLWSLLFFMHRIETVNRETETAAQLERLVVRAPHRQVFREATLCAAMARAGIKKARSAKDSAEKQAAAVDAIKGVLREVARFAQSFGGMSTAEYGANLMVARDPAVIKNDQRIREALRFFNTSSEQIETLRAVLCMDERFRISGSGSSDRHVPMICLPVPQNAVDDRDRWEAVPGAPMTFLDDNPSVHQDLDRFVSDCESFGNFTPSLIEDIRDYFQNEGAAVRSFASYKVGDSVILNIDCSEPFLLGQEEEFIPTFSALILPTQILLEDLLSLVYPPNVPMDGGAV
jgi:hypothetical protein